MAYLKKRSLILRTVAPSACWVRSTVILLIRSSTTSLTSSEKTATSRGRMMSCLSTLRIFSHSSPSLSKKIQDTRIVVSQKYWSQTSTDRRYSSLVFVLYLQVMMLNELISKLTDTKADNWVSLHTSSELIPVMWSRLIILLSLKSFISRGSESKLKGYRELTLRWVQWNGLSSLCILSRSPCFLSVVLRFQSSEPEPPGHGLRSRPPAEAQNETWIFFHTSYYAPAVTQ